MIYLQGGSSLSFYRHQELLTKLQRLLPDIHSFTVFIDYFVETKQELTPSEIELLTALLPNATVAALPQPLRLQFWVVPRWGTLSPWASKATDIAKICGLENIARIEHGCRYQIHGISEALFTENHRRLFSLLHDPLTESVIFEPHDLSTLFLHHKPNAFTVIPLLENGKAALLSANQKLGLALSLHEIEYLLGSYKKIKRNPTDVELMMFAQVNSEHCRHKIFNASWTIDEQVKPLSLFKMIKNTFAKSPKKVIVAYKDNAAVMKGKRAERFLLNPKTREYEYVLEAMPYILKVETHNHPTAISPFPGAATGSGGEIRDEAATGRGAETKAGLCGFSVSHLKIPGFLQPWETEIGKPNHIASPLDIMLQAPLGAASFNNEFGRPNILGYFRTCEMLLPSRYGDVCRGYHKPIMIAGGIGTIREMNIHKRPLIPGTLMIVLGGPALAIGLGGGSASSRQTAEQHEALDFASVQRANPEMQRRAQEVINVCLSMGENNPILSIHDVGAGGLSNALPELVYADHLGGEFDLRAIPSAESGMSPLEIWCNESQERYVLAIAPQHWSLFAEIAERERCPFAIVGEVRAKAQLTVHDPLFQNKAVDISMATLFEDMPPLPCSDKHAGPSKSELFLPSIDIAQAIQRVLQFPCVASKNFLITIGDRSVGGLVARDQMVGPWQIPVADCAVTCSSFSRYEGEAMAMGERAPLALLHHAASARMAVGEAITNLAAARIETMDDMVMSANWMAAADYPGEGAGLYDAVQTIAMELCPSLKIAIPVGKDSLSMRTSWEDNGKSKSVTAPLSLIITASAPVLDVRCTLTPQLKTDQGPTKLILIDLGKGANLLGASVLAQVYNSLAARPPDVDHPTLLRYFFKAIQSLNRRQWLLAYHDRSDGGLLVTIAEMMFAGHCGVTMSLDALGPEPMASLFSEELGAVIQVKTSDVDAVLTILQSYGLRNYSHVIGTVNATDELKIDFQQQCFYKNSRAVLQALWSETSYKIQALRDHAQCAEQEFQLIHDKNNTGLSEHVNFDYPRVLLAIHPGVKPRVAILREQGVNGHIEMAAAFDRVGFTSVDVHMSDLIAGRVDLSQFKGLAACGGFSYGDVLGAGRGWAQSILLHHHVRDAFQRFFHRKDTFAVGMCNGCQMMVYLRELIPGAEHWPYFIRNQSEQFEARLALVKIVDSRSIIFRDMAEAVLPIVVSHGEGYAHFSKPSDFDACKQQQLVALQYVDYQHQATERYPFNPNGSPEGITALTNHDGRVTIMMPHPERIFRTVQLSWHPTQWEENSPWIRLFQNARDFVD
ncbi:MAG: phosphoribosylformylglycinamidine synthase [Coxiella sp. RIFCSPHIGHO2_12_FULL_42_15]|nr:MAG: phosphoribosylformylglycinamidine synthase [Coxiella sp. RIFCSPHIGHO2_12_FULL_42_15]